MCSRPSFSCAVVFWSALLVRVCVAFPKSRFGSRCGLVMLFYLAPRGWIGLDWALLCYAARW